MGNTAKGKHALFISDRSGLAYPYREMVKEWNGARVHTSEYEPKQPQLEPTPYSADPQGLQHPRPQQFNLLTGGGGGIVTGPVRTLRVVGGCGGRDHRGCCCSRQPSLQAVDVVGHVATGGPSVEQKLTYPAEALQRLLNQAPGSLRENVFLIR